MHKLAYRRAEAASGEYSCPYRSVSRDGRVACGKIAGGDDSISPTLCGQCPFRAVDCSHLRFSLRLRTPSPLIVRFNGRTELWDDEPPRLSFDRAACAIRALPIEKCQDCTSCSLRHGMECGRVDSFLTAAVPAEANNLPPLALPSLPSRSPAGSSFGSPTSGAVRRGKVVPFRQPAPLAATG